MSELICPKCRTHIEIGERCPKMRGAFRCMETVGHDGWHWSEVGGPGLLRWTGLYAVKGCPKRRDLSHWCVKLPGHGSVHNDGFGCRWVSETQG